MSNNGPCLGCKDRMVGCHGMCQAYKKFKKERDEMNRKKNAELEARISSSNRLSWRDKKNIGLIKGGKR